MNSTKRLCLATLLRLQFITSRSKVKEVEIRREREEDDDKSRDFKSELGASNATLMGYADDAEVSFATTCCSIHRCLMNDFCFDLNVKCEAG